MKKANKDIVKTHEHVVVLEKLRQKHDSTSDKIWATNFFLFAKTNNGDFRMVKIKNYTMRLLIEYIKKIHQYGDVILSEKKYTTPRPK